MFPVKDEFIPIENKNSTFAPCNRNNLNCSNTFTLAEERNDIHTSACAMLPDFMEQMDIDNIKLMLSEVESLTDMDTETFFRKLKKAF
jgi:hypothetical protein